MKNIFLTIIYALLIFSCHTKDKSDSLKNIKYTITWDGKSSEVKVNLKLPTLGKKIIQFDYLPNPFKINFNPITNFSVVEDVTITKEGNRYFLQNDNELDIIEINYTINGKNLNDREEVGSFQALSTHKEPNVKEGHLQLLGRHFLLTPKDEDISALQHVVSWAGIPDDFKRFDLTKEKKVSLSEIHYSLYLFSKDLKIDSFEIKSIPHYILSTGKENVENHEIIKNAVLNAVPETMRFFNDYDFPYYFIYTNHSTAILKENKAKGRMGAEALTNGFVGTYIGEISIEESITVVHESIHRWLTSLEGNTDHLWFNEGFDEYITVYVSASSNFMDQEYFERFFNRQLKDYYCYVKQRPSEYRKNDYLKNNVGETMWINYSKGFVFAFYLDNKIRLATGGNKNIRDLMIAYNKKRKESDLSDGVNISLETFEKLIAEYLPISHVKSDIQKYMINGDYIDFSKEKLIKGILFDTRVIHLRDDTKDTIPSFKFVEKKDFKKIYSF